MGTENNGAGSQSVGVGRENDSSDGPEHASHRATGGSGGAGLTASQGDISRGNEQRGQTRVPESAATATVKGAQDTRSRQGGGTGTGLGTPETGANQDAADLPPRK